MSEARLSVVGDEDEDERREREEALLAEAIDAVIRILDRANLEQTSNRAELIYRQMGVDLITEELVQLNPAAARDLIGRVNTGLDDAEAAFRLQVIVATFPDDIPMSASEIR